MRQVVKLKNINPGQSVTCRLDGPFMKDGQAQTLTISAKEVVVVDAAVLRCPDVARRLAPAGPIKEVTRYVPSPTDPKPLFSLGE